MPNGELKPIYQMVTEMADEKHKNRRLYKALSDEHKAGELSKAIKEKATQLRRLHKSRITTNFNDLELVQQRTLDYFEACLRAEVFPSIMGLAVQGYGVSRHALNQYLNRHDNETTRYIEMVKDLIADILVNSSLFNQANAVAVIFQLKNHFEHADRMEIQPVRPHSILGEPLTEEELQRQIASLPPLDDEE